MPLRNRVDPLGEIVAVAARGTLMGNRGGCLHDGHRRLGRRRWASKAWIACVLDFRGRRRTVMTPGRYTELFFLDEATALAAGHRPCFECRRADALAFARAWAAARGLDARPLAGEMDEVLHAERIAPGRRKRTVAVAAVDLVDGVMILADGTPCLVWDGMARPWSFGGYGKAVALPRGTVEMITPRSTARVLAGGYRARVHPSAG